MDISGSYKYEHLAMKIFNMFLLYNFIRLFYISYVVQQGMKKQLLGMSIVAY